jgi:hypothetical protein
MASTGGGFLLGFGLCLLLVSLLAIAGASAVYEKLKERESDIAMLYNVTHSSSYQAVINALDTLSGVAYRIRDALCNPLISWMGLCSYGEELANTTTNAANYLREVQHISEKLYCTYIAMPMATQLLWISSLTGLAMIVAGTALIIRARRKEKAVKTWNP